MIANQCVRFRRWHLAWLIEQGAAIGGVGPCPDAETLFALEKQNSWTIVHDGDPIACFGAIEQWPGRSITWTYLGAVTAPHMVYITRKALEHLATLKGRIEATVRCDFLLGQRWTELLGFRIETPCLKGYGPEGEDHIGYVRVN